MTAEAGRSTAVVIALLILTFLSQDESRATMKARMESGHLPNYQFTNGRWFDGHRFQRRVFYSVNGVFTLQEPATVSRILDLADGYVVPPFGDAHNHNFDSPGTIASDIQMYLKDGIFYSMVQTDVRSGALTVAAKVNRPDSVDVIYAHGALTGIHSHPATSYEARTLGFYGHAQEVAHAAEIRVSHELDNDAYYTIEGAEELDRKWPAILAGKPDFIKIMLLHSEDYEVRKKRTGEGEGIDPGLVPMIVSKAHAAGLRVSAHIDSVYDLRAAVAAGVDMLAHLPGYYFRVEDEGKIDEVYALSAGDAHEIARRHIVMSPTANLADWEQDPDMKSRVRAMQIRNLRLLKKAGVKFGVGTDSYGMDAAKEAACLARLGLFSNLELLKLWAEDTPHIIYPQRRIGRLQEGYEASFLVLRSNPLEHFQATSEITMRFKQGRLLTALP
jgi:imidazolonepropionase-like amidohydrolase